MISELLANISEDATLIERPERLQFLDRQFVDDDFVSHGPIIHPLRLYRTRALLSRL